MTRADRMLEGIKRLCMDDIDATSDEDLLREAEEDRLGPIVYSAELGRIMELHAKGWREAVEASRQHRSKQSKGTL